MRPSRNIESSFPRDEQATGRFLAAVGGMDEAELVHIRALVSSESYTIAALDRDQTIVRWSRGGESMFGYAAADIVGRRLAILLTEIDEALAQLDRRVAMGETVELDTRLRRADGKTLHCFLTATPVRGADGAIVGSGVIIRDVSHAKEMERRLRETSQLEAIARAAAGIAHDINNVLAIVQAYAEFVADGPLSATQAEDLRLCREAAQRGATLTGQLLALDRQRDAEPEQLELNELLRSLEDLLQRSVGGGVELSMRLALSPLRVRAVPGKIDQILLNLALNARDAMPSGGKLEIALHGSVVQEGHPAFGGMRAGPCAKLSIRDTGVGMDAQTRDRIFEPFFTTKPPGRASGLGLLVVKEAVRELEGAISVESELDRGTTFTVCLPLVQFGKSTSVAPQAAQSSGAILVLDSDAVLRSAVRRILHRAGHATLEAADTAEAEAFLDAQGQRIRAVITDLPSQGSALTTSLRERPGLRRIYLSASTSALLDDPDASLVAKPFAGSELLSAVAQALATKPSVKAPPALRKPIVLIVDDDEELGQSLARVLAESDIEAHTTPSGLHALQLLKKMPVDVLITDQFMPGLEGTKLLELTHASFPATAGVLFTAHASPDVVVNAVNRGRVTKVLLKSMHPVAIRDEIAAIAYESMRRQVRGA